MSRLTGLLIIHKSGFTVQVLSRHAGQLFSWPQRTCLAALIFQHEVPDMWPAQHNPINGVHHTTATKNNAVLQHVLNTIQSTQPKFTFPSFKLNFRVP